MNNTKSVWLTSDAIECRDLDVSFICCGRTWYFYIITLLNFYSTACRICTYCQCISDICGEILNSCWYDWGCHSPNYEGSEASTAQRSCYRGV